MLFDDLVVVDLVVDVVELVVMVWDIVVWIGLVDWWFYLVVNRCLVIVVWWVLIEFIGVMQWLVDYVDRGVCLVDDFFDWVIVGGIVLVVIGMMYGVL